MGESGVPEQLIIPAIVLMEFGPKPPGWTGEGSGIRHSCIPRRRAWDQEPTPPPPESPQSARWGSVSNKTSCTLRRAGRFLMRYLRRATASNGARRCYLRAPDGKIFEIVRQPLRTHPVAPSTGIEQRGARVHHTLGDGDFSHLAQIFKQVTVAQTTLTPDNAAAQIAEELYQSGRTVYLSIGGAGRVPRRYRGKDTHEWSLLAGLFDRTVDQLPSPRAK